MNKNINNRNKNNRIFSSLIPYFCIFVFALIMLSMIINRQEFWSGYDTYFHMNSIYEDAMQIKTGHFSYFISLFGFEQSGRIVNSLYGPIFSYLCGALLLWCHSWIRFEFSLFLITAFISGSEMFICARMLHLHKVLSIILALFYMSSYPITIMWFISWEFTGFGAAVLIPMIIIVGIKIYQRRQIKVIPLAVAMAICLQIHMITSLIAVLVLIPLVLCSFVLTKAKMTMIKNGFIALVIAVCLSGNIFGAFYDIFRTNHLIPTFPNFDLQKTAGNNAVSIQKGMITDLGYLYTALIVIILILVVIEFKQISKLSWCLLFEDLFFLIISSTYFPWDRLLKYYPKLAIFIQFPARFVTVTFMLTLLLFGQLISDLPLISKRPLIANIVLILLFLVSLRPVFTVINHESQIWQASSGVVHYWAHHMNYGGFRYASQGNQIRSAVRSHNITQGINVVHKATMDYLPTNSHLNIFNYYNYPTRKTYVKDFQHQAKFHKITQDHTLLMHWRSNNIHKVELPLVKYGNTVVYLNHQRIYPKRSVVGTIIVKPRKGFNKVSIHYQPGKVFRIMALISLISWLVVLIYAFHKSWLVLMNSNLRMRKYYVK